MECVNILLVDDREDGLIAMEAVLQSPEYNLVKARSGTEALDCLSSEDFAVILLDVQMPLMDGFETVKSICAKNPAARLVVFTTCVGEEDIYRALRAGAFGYLLKSTSLPELIECILAVAQGKRWIPASVAAQLGKRVQDGGLTPRETQVMRTLTTGKSNKEIGSALDISESTVKVHVTHILEKLNVTGRTEAINVALKRGLVHMDQPETA